MISLRQLLGALATGQFITLKTNAGTHRGVVNGLRRESGVGRGDAWLVTLAGNEKNKEVFVRTQ